MKDALRKTLVAFGFVATAGIIGAAADVAVTVGSGTTVFAFTCFTTKVCPAAVTVNSAGTEIGTSANPLVIDTPASGNLYGAVNGSVPPGDNDVGKIRIRALASGATGGLAADIVQCDQKAIYDASTSGSTELVALTAARSIYICGKVLFSAGTVNVKLIYGTGTACATGSANLTPAYQLTAQVGLVDASPFYRGSKTASANALCINTSAGVAVQAEVYYSIL